MLCVLPQQHMEGHLCLLALYCPGSALGDAVIIGREGAVVAVAMVRRCNIWVSRPAQETSIIVFSVKSFFMFSSRKQS